MESTIFFVSYAFCAIMHFQISHKCMEIRRLAMITLWIFIQIHILNVILNKSIFLI